MPSWVKDGSVYHIRIRAAADYFTKLTDDRIALHITESVQAYHQTNRWHCRLFLLMPDHLHALLAFPPGKHMFEVIGGWKGYHAKKLGVRWQNNFFDHRIRCDESLDEKEAYIRNNPVVKGLCQRAEDWPWVIGPLE